MNNLLIAVAVLIILIGGGWWFMSQPKTDALPAGGAAGTMLEGGELPDNGMIGGDAAVGGSAMPVPGTDTPETVVIREFTITGSSYAFAPSTMTVKKGETVRLTFLNSGGKHDWVIDEITGARTKVLDAGGTETIEFVADKAGSFEYYCSVGKHRAMGMKGTFVVTE